MCCFQLSLRDNPLVVRFVSDMTHNPPSLMELAARVVKQHSVPYNPQEMPRSLHEYLQSAHHCVNPKCKGTSTPLAKFLPARPAYKIDKFYLH